MAKIYRYTIGLNGKDLVPSQTDLPLIDNESNVDMFQIRLNRYYADVDLSDGAVVIEVERGDGVVTNAVQVEVTDTDDSFIYVQWTVNTTITSKKGLGRFWVVVDGTSWAYKTGNAVFVVRASYVPPITTDPDWPDGNLQSNLTVVGEHWEELLINASYNSIGPNYEFTRLDQTVISLPASTGGNGGTDLTEVWEELNTHTNQIANLETGQAEQNTQILAIGSTVNALTNTVEEHSNQIGTLQNSVLAIGNDVTELTDRVDDVEAVQNAHNLLFGQIQTEINEINDGQLAQNNAITELREQIGNGIDLSELENRVTDVEAVQNSHDALFGQIQTEINGIENSLTDVQGSVANNTNDINEIYQSVDQITDELVTKIDGPSSPGYYVRTPESWFNVFNIPVQTDIIYVDPVNGTVNGTGSAISPFNTLEIALANPDNRSNKEIILSPGQHTVTDTSVFANLTDIVIRGYGSSGSILTQIVSDDMSVTIESQASGVSFINIDFSTNDTPIRINSAIANGSLYFDSCKFYQLTVYAADGSVLTDTHYKDCSFISTVDMYGIGSTHDFYRCSFNVNGGQSYLITRSNGMKVNVYGCTGVALNKSAGTVVVDGGTEFTTFGAGYCITDTSSGLNNVLALVSGTTLQTDGSYGRIYQVDPAGYYIIGAFVRNFDTSQDTFAGTRLAGGILDRDISATYTPQNYTASSNFLYGHLQGIDEQLQQLDMGWAVVGSVSSSGSTVDLPITDTLTMRLAYATATTASLSIVSSTTETVDIRRISHYDASSAEGSYSDNQTVTPTGYIIDGTVYTSSNDGGRVWVATATSWYEVKFFISGAGSRARMHCIRMLPSDGEALTDTQFEQLSQAIDALSAQLTVVQEQVPVANLTTETIEFEEVE